MENYSIINDAIQKLLKRRGEWKIAIYPFGEVGIKAKEILNWRYGVKEDIIVDNGLAKINENILSLDDVKEPGKYIWFLACLNPQVHDEVLRSIKILVPECQILDMNQNVKPYSEEYRLLSLIQTGGVSGFPPISKPCIEFLELIRKKKYEQKRITVAEIGVGIGATAIEVCKRLQSDDTYVCFDFEERVEDLLYDLNRNTEVSCKLIGKGNSHKIYDSYNWELSKMLLEMRNDGLNGIFDIVYLDGSHDFMHDGLACCMLKELVKVGGYIIFDDMHWSYGNSPTCNPQLNPEICEFFTDEQIKDCQIQRVVNIFMLEDRRFQQIYMTNTLNPGIAIYIKGM